MGTLSDIELKELQLKKLRRRIEDYLRHASPEVLVKIGEFCNIQIPNKIKRVYSDQTDH